jgi:DNA primase
MAQFHLCGMGRRERLPSPGDYFNGQNLQLSGGEWKSALCPFHNDTRLSLRVRLDTGAFRCMVCGAHGGDVLAFHMRRHALRFIDAAKALGAWSDL